MNPGSVPPDESIKFWVAISGLGAAVMAMFAAAINWGRKFEKLEHELKTAADKSEINEKAIEDLKTMTAKIEPLEDAIKQVLALFTDQDGNQRIMTMTICDKKSSSCNLVIAERMKHMSEMFGERIQSLERLIRAGNEAALDAILKAIKDK